MSPLKKYKEVEELCESFDNSAVQLMEIISRFVKLDTEYGQQLRASLGVSRQTLNWWISGTVLPSSTRWSSIRRFILRRVKRQIRILENAEAIKKGKGG